MRKRIIALLLAVAGISAIVAQVAFAGTHGAARATHPATNGDHRVTSGGGGWSDVPTATPVKHLVVIFQENVSFDHYFATYPNATNPPGEPPFHAAPDTPSVNGLSGALLTNNPNMSNPQRLDPSEAATCDQDHGYTAEQSAFDHGLMDKFVQDTGNGLTLQQCLTNEGNPTPATGTSPNFAVMDYYDGNTVTGLWNYAQHFALSDNSYGTNFGPSTPGAINVTSGQTYGAICGPSTAVINASPCSGTPGSATNTAPGASVAPGGGSVYSDSDPYYDVCSGAQQDKNAASGTIQMGGDNIGDLLDRAGVSWGWFQGGFASPNYVPGDPSSDDMSAVCTGSHKNILGKSALDYSPHHEPFQYYASTANPQHLPPTSIAMIGHQDQANHQYDIRDFFAAAEAGNLPAVSYLKAPEYEDGHAGYSDPLDEQRFLANTINTLEKLPSWKSTAVVINWDDSDGWYDHQIGPIVTQSQTSLDTLTDAGFCGTQASQVPTTSTGTPEQGRCGVGPRIPLLVISPFARQNYVDNTFTDQTSVVKFIEDNWLGGERIGNGAADTWSGTLDNMFDFSKPNAHRLFLDPSTGESQHGG
jgi:phospholipase C